MDRLRRRLGETIAGNAGLDAGSAGELRLRTRAAAPLAVVASAAPTAPTAPIAQVLVGAVPANRGVATRPARGRAADWSYDGSAGPQAWARLDPAFAKCASGQRQSPIDNRGGIALDLDPLQFDYRPSRFSVVDNGHTVQVDLAPGNFSETMGRRYALRQFHFHRPSEERIDGRRFEMVVHLVHESDDGRLAMVAVLLDRGAAQPLLQTVWNNLPLEKGEPLSARPLIDLNQLLPDDRRYYTYMGSMTTPPCSEGVLWIVMQQPVPVSPTQIDIFSRLYPMNARPVQDAAGRMIKQSN
jgi:carbonic anhydrase